MLPKIAKIDCPLKIRTINIRKKRSKSGKQADNIENTSKRKNFSPRLAIPKNLVSKENFRRAEDEEENYFNELIRALK